ncbi:hypothetical protein [Nocardioides lacusdianchii]|uniref:hypothetical protein n=1 Tax=Nocardioides lacusdianchii TaxID=2783664 RepID=UPI001CCE7CA0|nr:hypothetical protein [Nocardioides lacusdianchii]
MGQHEITIDFGDFDLTGVLEHDRAGRELVLVTDEGPEWLSIQLTQYGLIPEPGNVFIKDWSEHSGLAGRMAGQGLVTIVSSVNVGPFSSRAFEVTPVATEHQDALRSATLQAGVLPGHGRASETDRKPAVSAPESPPATGPGL